MSELRQARCLSCLYHAYLMFVLFQVCDPKSHMHMPSALRQKGLPSLGQHYFE